MSRFYSYYNEIDPGAAAWLRELMRAGLIATGAVDERDIRDVSPNDLRGFTQHHFFAGIGVWSYALRLAGWPDDKPVWTGSCPCQPFSSAGKKAGFADERHLWPAWYWLISQSRPHVIFGEQVANGDGLAWLDLISADLEAGVYTVGAVNLPACGVGAPHIRQRLFFVADSLPTGRAKGWAESGNGSPAWSGGARELGHAGSERSRRNAGAVSRPQGTRSIEGRGAGDIADQPVPSGESRIVGDSGRSGRSGRSGERGDDGTKLAPAERTSGSADGMENAEGLARRIYKGSGRPIEGASYVRGRGPTNGFWGDADWIPCRDGKYRPVEPGTFPLAHGAPARVGRLRGYGNAINAEAAAQVIAAYLGARSC